MNVSAQVSLLSEVGLVVDTTLNLVRFKAPLEHVHEKLSQTHITLLLSLIRSNIQTKSIICGHKY